MLAAGSGEILRAVTLAFTGPGQGAGARRRRRSKSPARTAQSDEGRGPRDSRRAATGTLDLKAMAGASSGAGTGVRLQPQQPDRRHQPRRGGRRVRQGVPRRVARRLRARRRGVLRLRHRSVLRLRDSDHADRSASAGLADLLEDSRHGRSSRRLRRRPPRRARAPFAPGPARARCRASAPPRRSRRSRIRSTSLSQKHAEPRGAGVHAQGVRDRRLQGAAVGRQLRDGRRQARVLPSTSSCAAKQASRSRGRFRR